MINVGVFVTDRCQASSIHTVLDVFIAANHVAKKYLGEQRSPFELQLIGLHSTAKAYNQTILDHIQLVDQVTPPDMVIIPGAFEATITQKEASEFLEQHQKISQILKAWHKQGVLLSSACTGNFLLANSGVAMGRALTCHWASTDLAKKMFPNESFESQKLILDHGDIVSAGGASAIAQLIMYLLTREHSRELALLTAKMMLIDVSLDDQSRFAIFKPNMTHSDPLVLTLQKMLQEKFHLPLDLTGFANKHGLSEKQIVRRFKHITAETPLSYLQKLRVEQSKLDLETTSKSSNQIIWDVGYEDSTSFRRLFKRMTGLTMLEYRSRFSIKI